MNAWIEQLKAVLNLVLGNPASPTEFAVLLGVAILLFLVMLPIVSSAWGLKRTGWGQAFLTGTLGLLLALGTVGAVRVYALPAIEGPALQAAAQIVAVALVILLIYVPLQGWIMKGNYFKSLLSLVTAVFAAGLLTALAHAGYGAISKGAASADAQRQKKAQTEKEISDY